MYLLSLLDESLAEELPSDVLHNTTGFFQALVDWHCAHLTHKPIIKQQTKPGMLLFCSKALAEACKGTI